MVAMVVVVTAIAVGYQRLQSTRAASAAARKNASFGADAAARRLSIDFESLQGRLSRLAADPQVTGLFESVSPACVVDFSGSGTLSGHLEILAADGSIACSSLPGPIAGGYRAEPWVPASLDRASISAPVIDSRTGNLVVVVTAPIPGHGLAAAFLDLAALGRTLGSTFGGPRDLEFLVATADGQRAVTRSIDPGRWVGTSIVDTPFAGSPLDAPGRDLDGRSRYYSLAIVGATGWRVYAGEDRGASLSMANDVRRSDLIVGLTFLLVVISTGFVLSRRISSPIIALSEQIRAPV
ncbi:MAG: Cache domain, partial [Actinomycetota bacterium]|nr:Cache domain [Actinomycetota bacterium]